MLTQLFTYVGAITVGASVATLLIGLVRALTRRSQPGNPKLAARKPRDWYGV